MEDRHHGRGSVDGALEPEGDIDQHPQQGIEGGVDRLALQVAPHLGPDELRLEHREITQIGLLLNGGQQARAHPFHRIQLLKGPDDAPVPVPVIGHCQRQFPGSLECRALVGLEQRGKAGNAAQAIFQLIGGRVVEVDLALLPRRRSERALQPLKNAHPPGIGVGPHLAFPLTQADDDLVPFRDVVALDGAAAQALFGESRPNPAQVGGVLELDVDQGAAAEIDSVAGAALEIEGGQTGRDQQQGEGQPEPFPSDPVDVDVFQQLHGLRFLPGSGGLQFQTRCRLPFGHRAFPQCSRKTEPGPKPVRKPPSPEAPDRID